MGKVWPSLVSAVLILGNGDPNLSQGIFLVPNFQGSSFFGEKHEYIHGIYLVYTA